MRLQIAFPVQLESTEQPAKPQALARGTVLPVGTRQAAMLLGLLRQIVFHVQRADTLLCLVA